MRNINKEHNTFSLGYVYVSIIYRFQRIPLLFLNLFRTMVNSSCHHCDIFLTLYKILLTKKYLCSVPKHHRSDRLEASRRVLFPEHRRSLVPDHNIHLLYFQCDNINKKGTINKMPEQMIVELTLKVHLLGRTTDPYTIEADNRCIPC